MFTREDIGWAMHWLFRQVEGQQRSLFNSNLLCDCKVVNNHTATNALCHTFLSGSYHFVVVDILFSTVGQMRHTSAFNHTCWLHGLYLPPLNVERAWTTQLAWVQHRFRVHWRRRSFRTFFVVISFQKPSSHSQVVFAKCSPVSIKAWYFDAMQASDYQFCPNSITESWNERKHKGRVHTKSFR